MNPTSTTSPVPFFDAFIPPEMAVRAEDTGVKKAVMAWGVLCKPDWEFDPIFGNPTVEDRTVMSLKHRNQHVS